MDRKKVEHPLPAEIGRSKSPFMLRMDRRVRQNITVMLQSALEIAEQELAGCEW